MKNFVAMLAVVALTAVSAQAALSDGIAADPLGNTTDNTATLDKFNGPGTLTKVTLTLNYNLVNLVEGLATPLASNTQTGFTNNDPSSADAQIISQVALDVPGIAGALNLIAGTTSTVQTMPQNIHFDWDIEGPGASTGVASIMYTGAGDLAAFTGAGTIDIIAAITGAWSFGQVGQLGQGNVSVSFDSAIAGTVSVAYESTLIPTPAAGGMALVGLVGLALRRRR